MSSVAFSVRVRSSDCSFKRTAMLGLLFSLSDHLYFAALFSAYNINYIDAKTMLPMKTHIHFSTRIFQFASYFCLQ